MSTFYHSDSPLISGNSFPPFLPANQNNSSDPYSLYKQQLINTYVSQQPPVPNQTPQHDFLNELDILTKGLDRETLERLNKDSRYLELQGKLQSSIQEELMNMIKNKINSNTSLSENIKEEIDIINKIKNEVKEEERNNYYEMQDYLKNYSHLTFDDYKKLKNKKNEIQKEEIVYEN